MKLTPEVIKIGLAILGFTAASFVYTYAAINGLEDKYDCRLDRIEARLIKIEKSSARIEAHLEWLMSNY